MEQAKVGSITLASLKLRRSGPISFLKEVIAELKKVTWPTREETTKLTIMVIVISVVVGAFIGGLDIVLVKITSLVLKR